MKNSEKNTMLEFDDAFEVVMNSISGRALGSERVDIEDTLNRVLAEDVASDMDIPPFNKSVMDGFACLRADLKNELTIIETIPAGLEPKKTIGPNQCSRIMTGGVVPESADCVIMVEYTEATSDNKILFTGEQTDNNIRLKGEDIKKGDIVLQSGHVISAQHIAVLASLGCTKPLLAVKPRVGVIATGDELVEPGQKPSACQIRNSNGFQLAAQVTSTGATATNYGITADVEEAIDAIFEKSAAENDVVIFSGGVSMGDYDLVRGILRKNNVRLLVDKVAVKPGKPTVFGVYDEGQKNRVFCFGLPGNPVSTFTIFELLIKPFLFKMMGHNFKPVVSYRQLEKAITREKTERDSWVPVVFTEKNKVTNIEYHGSAHISALCEADGLIYIPAGIAEFEEGTTIAVRHI